MEPAAFSDATRFHPLELIPFFRRFPCSRGRNLVYTFIWSALLCALFLLPTTAFQGRLPTPHQAWLYLVVSLFIGYAIHALFEGTALLGLDSRARQHGIVGKTIYFSLIPMLGAIAGFQAADWVLGIGFDNWLVTPGWILSIAGTSLSISIVISTVFYVREREARSEAALAAGRARVERMEREAIAANLRALQAQIEPHFLFNTLANVSSLVDRDPREAKRMLERFIRFLRASLAATRMERTTLGAERELIAAYLDVLQVRMGERLRYEIDVAPDLDAFAIAPMLLQPIVENAIRHGIEPRVEGGGIRVAARREGGEVVVEIADTGVGFAPKAEGGVGLSNLRERLRGLYGPQAALAIAENPRGGTVVTLRIPA